MAIGSSKKLNWLIVEDALRDRHGHWLEFVMCFKKGLSELGDAVRIFGPCNAAEDVIEETGLEPALPESLWRGRGEKSVGSVVQVLSRLAWGVAYAKAILRAARSSPRPDVVFVPTVGIPHLLVWVVLLKTKLRSFPGVIVLYFMSTPVRCSPDTGRVEIVGIGGRIFFAVLALLSSESTQARLVLAAETDALSHALQALSGSRFRTIPQPVTPFWEVAKTKSLHRTSSVLFACFGPARYDKGSDLLLLAAGNAVAKRKDVALVIQWLGPFSDPHGNIINLPQDLLNNRQVTIIDHLFAPGEYCEWLRKTDVMVLPYRSEYLLRGSRVVVEAMVHGIPTIVSAGTTLHQQAEKFGVAVPCDLNSADKLEEAIIQAADRWQELRNRAVSARMRAQESFSVARFRFLIQGDGSEKLLESDANC